jgi:hypothetical protein
MAWQDGFLLYLITLERYSVSLDMAKAPLHELCPNVAELTAILALLREDMEDASPNGQSASIGLSWLDGKAI